MTARYIVLMGMQGAGKGTQAEKLSAALNIPHVTSGGMFRAIKGQDTPLAREIAAVYDSGKLIPDDLTIQLIQSWLHEPDAHNGVILDGFPRTLPQAQALDALLSEMGTRIDCVPLFTISEQTAMRRLGGRRQCTLNDQHIYHIEDNPPKVPGICDIDGAPLKIRPDDTPDGIKVRIDAFKTETMPVIDYYHAEGLLREIDAEQSIDQVSADVLSAVEAAYKP